MKSGKKAEGTKPAPALRERSGTARPRMADVARIAGVSTATVSRALRQPELVSPEVRGKIAAAVEHLSYRPNLMAGALASARSKTIGVIIPSMINAFFSVTLEAIEEGLAGAGYQLLIGNSHYEMETEERLIASMLAWSPAALVVTGCRHSRGAMRALLDTDVPIVEMWELTDNPIDTAIGFSQRDIGVAVARHFKERGARRLGFVGAMHQRDYRADSRRAGFFETALSIGYEPPAEVQLPGLPTSVRGAKAFAELMAGHPDVDAVLCTNDIVALGALFEAQRLGWSVPDRLKICGVGDVDFAAACEPGLSTVSLPRRAIGLKIAEVLRERIAGRLPTGGVHDLGFELVRRGST